MMLCDISVVFNSFADAFGLMNRKRSSDSRQVLVSFQSTESLGHLEYAGGGPARCHRSILPSFHVAADVSVQASERRSLEPPEKAALRTGQGEHA